MFTLIKDGHITFLLVYVDDVILADTSSQEFHRIKQILHNAFKIKDHGKLKYFIGLEVAHSEEVIIISQRKYCLDLLEYTRSLAAKPVDTPLNSSIKLYQYQSKPFEDVITYIRLIGRLLYLKNTRPGITLETQ